MEGVILKSFSRHPYLGVELQRDLQWKSHIDNITSKANKTLGLTKRNPHKCSQEVKAKACTTLVRSNLEYSSAVWDPYRKCQINPPTKFNAGLPVLFYTITVDNPVLLVCCPHLTGQLSKIEGKLQDCVYSTKPYTTPYPQ